MQGTSTWQPGPAAIQIAPEDLHLWLARLDVPGNTVATLYQTLSPDERPAFLSTNNVVEDASRWSLLAVDVAPGYEAAVAVEGSLSTLQKWLFRLQVS